VHQAGAELLQELPLPEDVGELSAQTLLGGVLAAGRSRVPDQGRAEPEPPDEQDDGDRDDDREDRGG
jgi:hypothetical protein